MGCPVSKMGGTVLESSFSNRWGGASGVALWQCYRPLHVHVFTGANNTWWNAVFIRMKHYMLCTSSVLERSLHSAYESIDKGLHRMFSRVLVGSAANVSLT